MEGTNSTCGPSVHVDHQFTSAIESISIPFLYKNPRKLYNLFKWIDKHTHTRTSLPHIKHASSFNIVVHSTPLISIPMWFPRKSWDAIPTCWEYRWWTPSTMSWTPLGKSSKARWDFWRVTMTNDKCLQPIGPWGLCCLPRLIVGNFIFMCVCEIIVASHFVTIASCRDCQIG